MSGCHIPEDKGNTHHCSGCGVVVKECKCIWNNFRQLYELFTNLTIRVNTINDNAATVGLFANQRQTVETWQKGCEVLITELTKRIKDIEYRLLHITALPSELDIRLQEVERRIDNMGDNVGKLRKEFESKLEVDLEKWREYYAKVFVKKTPHKCPVCAGMGGVRHPLTVIAATCKGCEGEGIVWG